MSEQEEWRAVIGFEGAYEVSSLGRVRRIDRAPYKVLKPYMTLGYWELKLSVNGKRKKVWIHRLVAEAFLGPAPSVTHEVAHNDGSRLNCVSSNIRWATREENREDRLRHGTWGWKLKEEQVKSILQERPRGKRRKEMAKQLGVSISTIHYVMAGRLWSHVKV